MKPCIFYLSVFLLLSVSLPWVNALGAESDAPMEYHISVTAQGSSKKLAPYMLGSWNEGRYVEGSGIWNEGGLSRRLDLGRRFSWSAGIDYIAGVASAMRYEHWDANTNSWSPRKATLPGIRLNQLYMTGKYRGVYLTVGMKNTHSKIVDDYLSSGDLTRSNNAEAIPGVSAGFVDFQNIPFTKGWVQIDGEIMYGKMTDTKWKETQFNGYSGIEGINLWYNYKRCYFRTNPDKRFHVVVGMQAAGLFGGATRIYQKGELLENTVRGFRVKDLLQMFFPREGGENYYTGSHLGSWDLKAVYKLRDGSSVNAYFEWPWEDGSGIGRMNGFDGLWGVQYNFAKKGIVSKVVAEYLDFTNQSGPIHYSPFDHPDNPLSGHAKGADNYYNNDIYGPYANYGISIGTPFLISPIYNADGMPLFLHNRARGFHAAVEGDPTGRLGYRAMVGYQVAGGYGRTPAAHRRRTASAMLEAIWKPSKRYPGLECVARIAADAGSLRGNNFGGQLRISYSGGFPIKKKTSK